MPFPLPLRVDSREASELSAWRALRARTLRRFRTVGLVVAGGFASVGWGGESMPAERPDRLPTRADSLFRDAWNRLPPRVRSTLTDPATGRPGVRLELDEKSEPLPDPAVLCGVSGMEETFELARYQPRPWAGVQTIVVNAHLASRYSPATPLAAPLPCRHGSLHRESIAAVLHELAHVYEARVRWMHPWGGGDSLPVPSGDRIFLRDAEFAPGWLGASNKNTNPERSPDPYEVRSADEAFAVNFEYFLLDSTYACRRPSLSGYLARSFGFDPFPDRTCRTNTKVFVFTESNDRERDLDPSRIWRIDYLVASPGTGFVSRWGHAMLRLAICAPERFDSLTGRSLSAVPLGPRCLDNTLDHVVVSFRADLRGFDPGIGNLVFGRLPSRMFLLTFDEVFREYLHGDLRDLVAYPLALDTLEKRELVERILENHWGYEGDYHFLTRNCATETRDLVASVKGRRSGKRAPTAWSPLGVREQMASRGWLGTDSLRTYPSLLGVLKRIWNEGKILDGSPAKSDAKAQGAIVSYMERSRAEDRLRTLRERLSKSVDSVVDLRDFIVMESQILRFQEELVKDRVFSLGREDAPARMARLEKAWSFRPDRRGGGSYGIPLENEIAPPAEIVEAVDRFRKAQDSLFQQVRAKLADRIHEIEQTHRNLELAFQWQKAATRPKGSEP